MDVWEIYYDELRRRAGGERRFGQAEAVAEAAHGAYRATADRLTADGWPDERVLVLTHAFGETVREWIGRGDGDWEGLRERLRERAAQWRDGSGRGGDEVGA